MLSFTSKVYVLLNDPHIFGLNVCTDSSSVISLVLSLKVIVLDRMDTRGRSSASPVTVHHLVGPELVRSEHVCENGLVKQVIFILEYALLLDELELLVFGDFFEPFFHSYV